MALSPAKTLSIPPSVNSLTLLFKHHKSTTLLSVFPAQPFSEIKLLLLVALQSRNIKSLSSTTGPSIPLPENPEDIEFGVLTDKKNPSKGWTSLDDPNNKSGKSNGIKGKKRERSLPTATTADDGQNNTPDSVGLTDGSFVAYRVRPTRDSKSKNKGKRRLEEDVDGEEEDMEVTLVLDLDSDDDPGWDVILPTFEEEDRVDRDADDMLQEGIDGR